MSVLIISQPRWPRGSRVYLGELAQSRHVIAERVTAVLLGKQQKVRLRHFSKVCFVARLDMNRFIDRARTALRHELAASPWGEHYPRIQRLAKKQYKAAILRLKKKYGAESIVLVGSRYK